MHTFIKTCLASFNISNGNIHAYICCVHVKEKDVEDGKKRDGFFFPLDSCFIIINSIIHFNFLYAVNSNTHAMVPDN